MLGRYGDCSSKKIHIHLWSWPRGIWSFLGWIIFYYSLTFIHKLYNVCYNCFCFQQLFYLAFLCKQKHEANIVYITDNNCVLFVTHTVCQSIDISSIGCTRTRTRTVCTEYILSDFAISSSRAYTDSYLSVHSSSPSSCSLYTGNVNKKYMYLSYVSGQLKSYSLFLSIHKTYVIGNHEFIIVIIYYKTSFYWKSCL
jgi:hypothetical protein